MTTVVQQSRVSPQGAVDAEGNFHALHQIRKSEICDCHNVWCDGTCISDAEIHFSAVITATTGVITSFEGVIERPYPLELTAGRAIHVLRASNGTEYRGVPMSYKNSR